VTTRLGRAAGGIAGTVGLLALAVAVSTAWHHPATRPLARACCGYSPDRLARGEIWTLLGSALLLPRVRMMGPTTLMTATLFLPYVLAAGTRSALWAFFSGHVLATLAVAAVVLPAAAHGWAPAMVLRTRSDTGASAGLAATAGAFCMLLGPRRAGRLGLTALGAWFGANLLQGHRLVEVEHLIALASGALTEWRRDSAEPWEASEESRRSTSVPSALVVASRRNPRARR
jgi:hypothetical protein